MKRVSFKVSTALKEAGYPQIESKTQTYYCKQYNFVKKEYFWELRDGDEIDFECNREYNSTSLILAPTYLEVWLWLWREKMECINIMTVIDGECRAICNNGDIMPKCEDPEEAIITAIEYLVTNRLIR